MAIQAPKTRAKAQLTESDLQHHSQELGIMGRWFGSRENAPVYFAGILGVAALIGAIAIAEWGPETTEKADVVKLLLGVVFSSLSFIGGASGRTSD